MGEQGLRISRRTLIGGSLALGATSLFSPLVAFAAPTAAEKKAEADAVRIQYESLKTDLDYKLQTYWGALDDHDSALAAMEEAQVHIDETTAQISELQGKLGTRARSMYRSGGNSFFDLLFGATTFTEFATNWEILNKMNEDDATMVSQTKVLREDLQATHKVYAEQERIAAQKTDEARVAKEETERAAGQYQSLLDSLDAETRELLQQEAQAAAEAAAVQQIAQQERDRAANPEQPPASQGDTTPPSGSGGGSGNPSANSGGGNNDSGNNDSGNNDKPSSSGGGSKAPVDFGPPAADIVSEAAKYVGKVPYVYGGNSPEQGFDCSGFVCWCCRQTGRSVPPRSTYGYPESGWFSVSEAQPGDILWQREHVGICTAAGGGSYVHAADPSSGICYGSSPQFTRAYRY